MTETEKTLVSTENFEATEAQLEAVRLAARIAAQAENALERYASIVLTDDETIHRLNRDYRGVDRPTDVLSFPADEGDELLAPPDGFLGDIMISVPRAEAQGKELGHSTERELAFLTVHGMLHLLGYDHIDPEDEKEMLSRQRAIMSLEPRAALGSEKTNETEANTESSESVKAMKKINGFEIKKMIGLAQEARERAYAPYSKCRVGACLKAASGAYYLGCNIENASYSPTVCAERTAVFKAIYEGEREFEALAVCSDSKNCTSPCGVCRQVLSEFCSPDMPVILVSSTGEYRLISLGELLPLAFTKGDME